MARRHTREFSQAMTEFYKHNKDASLDKAKKHAAKLGYPEFSQGAHDHYRKKAEGKRLRANKRKAAAGELEAPDRCWMDLSNGRFCTDFDLGKPGTRVAIYKLVATGAISLAYPRKA